MRMISNTPAGEFENGQAEIPPFPCSPVALAPVSSAKALGAMEDILFILKQRGLSEGAIDQYRSHYQALGAYIEERNLLTVDGQTLLDFLSDRYDLRIAGFHVRNLGSAANSHIRPMVIIEWYLTKARRRMRTASKRVR